MNSNEFRWLSRDVIEEKIISDPSLNDKINNYSSTGEAVGGVVAGFLFNFFKKSFIDIVYASTNSHNLQLQRVASRCSCQLFFCYFSDMIMEKHGEEILLPLVYFLRHF